MSQFLCAFVLACLAQANAEEPPVAPALGRAAVVQYAEPALREHLQARYDDVVVEPAGRTAAPGCADARFVGREMAPSPLSPRMLVNVTAECADGAQETLPVWFDVRASAEVAVAARDLPAGTAITAADVRVAKAEVQRVEPQLLPAQASPVGMRALVPVKAGAPLMRTTVRKDPDVVAQQPVLIRAASGSVKVEILGLALQNGRVGDRVQVLNLSSGDTLSARVIQTRAVEVLQ